MMQDTTTPHWGSTTIKALLFCAAALSLSNPSSAQIISSHGHPEHFIAGAVIGGGVSYLAFYKTDHKLKSWALGFAAATAVGGLKEILDPAFNRVRSFKDFQYTALGGALGASIVIPLRSRKGQGEEPGIAPFF